MVLIVAATQAKYVLHHSRNKLSRKRIRLKCLKLGHRNCITSSALAGQHDNGRSLHAKKKCLFILDRDGVINRDVGSPGVVKSEDLVLENGAALAIEALNSHGHHVVVATNQSCVGKGIILESELIDIHDKMKMMLEEEAGAVIDHIYYATETATAMQMQQDRMHQQRDNVNASNTMTREEIVKQWRKPGGGMILAAMRDFGYLPNRFDFINKEDNTMHDVIMVGDRCTDMVAGAQAGVSLRILVLTDSNYGRNMTKALCYRYQKSLLEDNYSNSKFHHLSFCEIHNEVIEAFKELAMDDIRDDEELINELSHACSIGTSAIKVFNSLNSFVHYYLENCN